MTGDVTLSRLSYVDHHHVFTHLILCRSAEAILADANMKHLAVVAFQDSEDKSVERLEHIDEIEAFQREKHIELQA
jgi:hypothetical protein